MPPFLLLLWLNAVLVSPTSATVAGGLYVAARAYYPLVLGRKLGRGIRAQVLLSTLVGYTVIGWYCLALLWGLAR
jgi:hypothetical protein